MFTFFTYILFLLCLDALKSLNPNKVIKHYNIDITLHW